MSKRSLNGMVTRDNFCQTTVRLYFHFFLFVFCYVIEIFFLQVNRGMKAGPNGILYVSTGRISSEIRSYKLKSKREIAYITNFSAFIQIYVWILSIVLYIIDDVAGV